MAIESHMRKEIVIPKNGMYREKAVTHYYDLETKINVITDRDGNCMSAWKLSKTQIEALTTTGKLGGGD